ncbi:hypothetical protein AB0H42_17260 [Nocardia sp. NPDC050799]|uniref:hypothetical protein n=1 Tax=Nocardia sp. NPDC050799 TaxID=3154842 RepID=UPI0033DE5E12
MSPAARATTNRRRAPQPVGAAEFVPGGADLGQVRVAAADCRGGDLGRGRYAATPSNARASG